MKLNTLKPASGSVRANKRVGRGQASGGGTAGRGHKGSQSRSGYSRKIGFEGGQMPLQRRVPKFGFKNNNKIYFKSVNLDTLQTLQDVHKTDTMDLAFFVEHGIAGKHDKIKILGRGELKAKIHVTAHAFSATAQKAIESAGGKAAKLEK